AADFPAASEADWLAQVEKSLKGKDFDKALTKPDYDGGRILPLYVGDPSATRAGHGEATGATATMPANVDPQRPWHILVSADLAAPGANEHLLQSLENGASAVGLRLHSAPEGGFVEWLTRALNGVRLDLVPIRLRGGAHALPLAAAFTAYAGKLNIDGKTLSGSFGADPLGTLAATGALAEPVGEALANAAAAAKASTLPLAMFDVATQPYHLAGASDGQELGIALATGVAYLRALETAGFSAAKAAIEIGFTLVADARMFETIAKFRAARLLWRRVLEAAGVTDVPMALAAETAERMMSRADPHVNMLRVTAAAQAAGIAGAEMIEVAPFDAAGVESMPLARRLARNTQLILQAESHLGRVRDPAAGSYYVEARTRELIDAAWKVFQEIEAAGGMAAALTDGRIASMLTATADRRDADIARRRMPLTGVSEFPDLDQALLHPLPPVRTDTVAVAGNFEDLVARLASGASLADLAVESEPQRIAPLAPRRLAQSFEDLRDAAAATGPVIFAATFGALPEYNARLLWLRNALAAGGVALAGGEPAADVKEVAEAFKASGLSVAVICASDAAYETQLGALAAALREAGATHVLLAGRPPADAPALDGSLQAGGDLVAALTGLHRLLGIAVKGAA
ncbi:MAG: methylmalonyl-CoA mutase family protein, partial [Flavobacteriaceae bacterium]